MTRPTKATVQHLLALQDREVLIDTPELVEDENGPQGVNPTTSCQLIVNITALGWTQEELDNPNITE